MFPCSHSLFPSPSSGNSSCPLIGPPTEPRFESRRCDLCQSQEEKQTDLPTHLKVANRPRLVAEGSPARAGAERSEREKGGNYALGIPKGAALGAPLVTFSATGKSPGVEGRSALPMGVVGAQPPLGEERGAKSDDLLLEGRQPLLASVGAGATSPAQTPGCRAERLHQGRLGLPAPHNFSGYGAEPPCNIK